MCIDQLGSSNGRTFALHAKNNCSNQLLSTMCEHSLMDKAIAFEAKDSQFKSVCSYHIVFLAHQLERSVEARKVLGAIPRVDTIW